MSEAQKKPELQSTEEAMRAQPQAREPSTDMMSRLASLKEARISKAEPTVTEDTRRRMIQGLCTEFFSACLDKAKKEGTSNAFDNSQMKQFFG